MTSRTKVLIGLLLAVTLGGGYYLYEKARPSADEIPSTTSLDYLELSHLDSSFSEDGFALAEFPLPPATPNSAGQVNESDLSMSALKKDASGRYVAAGFVQAVTSYTDDELVDFKIALARFNGDGTSDSTFGEGGKIVTSTVVKMTTFQASSRPIRLAVAPNGKIVVGWASSDRKSLFLQRYEASGSLDTNFAAASTSTSVIGLVQDLVSTNDQYHFDALLIDSDQRVTVVARAISSGDVRILRRLENGQPDTSWTTTKLAFSALILSLTGKALNPAIDSARMDDLRAAQTSTGQTVVTGQLTVRQCPPTDDGFFIPFNCTSTHVVTSSYLDANGAPVTSLGSEGVVALHILDDTEFFRESLITSDGQYVLLGDGEKVYRILYFNGVGQPDTAYNALSTTSGNAVSGFTTLDQALQRQTTYDFGFSMMVEEMVMADDGAITLILQPIMPVIIRGAEHHLWIMTRHTAQGAVDTSFAIDGLAVISTNHNEIRGNEHISVLADGDRLVFGNTLLYSVTPTTVPNELTPVFSIFRMANGRVANIPTSTPTPPTSVNSPEATPSSKPTFTSGSSSPAEHPSARGGKTTVGSCLTDPAGIASVVLEFTNPDGSKPILQLEPVAGQPGCFSAQASLPYNKGTSQAHYIFTQVATNNLGVVTRSATSDIYVAPNTKTTFDGSSGGPSEFGREGGGFAITAVIDEPDEIDELIMEFLRPDGTIATKKFGDESKGYAPTAGSWSKGTWKGVASIPKHSSVDDSSRPKTDEVYKLTMIARDKTGVKTRSGTSDVVVRAN